MRRSRALTVLELLAVCAVLGVLAALAIVPAYQSYAAGRAAGDAAQTFAQDLSLAERVAQNGGPFEGATLQIVSAEPLTYECRRGRPTDLDPRSSLGALIVRRRLDGVSLAAGPIDLHTPLLFAANGSAQYRAADGTWPDQHQTVVVEFAASADPARTAAVALDLFTGAIAMR